MRPEAGAVGAVVYRESESIKGEEERKWYGRTKEKTCER